MAGITASVAPPSGNQPMPLWLDDFCESLRLTYDCPRKDFHLGTAYCSDVSRWLNLFFPDQPRPVNPGDPLTVIMPNGQNDKISVTHDKVHAPKLTGPEMALDMALLALANPAFRAKGVQLEGTPEEIALLAFACQLVGLQLQSQQQVTHSLSGKERKGTLRAWKKMKKDFDSGAQNYVAAKKTDLDANMLHNTLNPAVQSILGPVSAKTYSAAKNKVWNDQSVSSQKLMHDFKVSAGDADNMIKAMKQESLVSEPTPGQFHVLVDKNVQWSPV